MRSISYRSRRTSTSRGQAAACNNNIVSHPIRHKGIHFFQNLYQALR